MKAKALEVRDEGTSIAVLAVDMNPDVLGMYDVPPRDKTFDSQRYLLRRCGYRCNGEPNVIITRLDGFGKATNDPYEWGDRTWQTAHRYIIENWHDLSDGDVVDVEFILGETKVPKQSESA